MRPLTWFPDDLRPQAEESLGGKHLASPAVTFAKLREYGDSLIRRKLGKAFFEANFPSNRSGGPWSRGQPTGVVDHFTAATAVDGTLSWFSNRPRIDPKKGPVKSPENPAQGKIKEDYPNSSSHFVIDRTGDIYPIIDCNRIAWHCRPANPSSIGIELVNAGKLIRQDHRKNGRLLYMGIYSYPRDRYSLAQELEGGTIWESYLTPQVLSSIILKRWLIDLFPGMTRDKFTDHHRLEPDRKEDCGPLWPLDSINDLVFSWRDMTREIWVDTGILSGAVFKEIEECARDKD